jgi:hypothetical protein
MSYRQELLQWFFMKCVVQESFVVFECFILELKFITIELKVLYVYFELKFQTVSSCFF